MGDLNVDYTKNTTETKRLKSMCKEMNLVQIVNRATRIATRNTQQGLQFSSTLLDHIMYQIKYLVWENM